MINNYVERAGGNTGRRNSFFYDQQGSGSVSINNTLSGNLATFPYLSSTTNVLASPVTSFVMGGQSVGKLFQGGWPSIETVTAITSADINADGKEEVFVALYYPNERFTKVVYSEGGSRELSEVAYTSTTWRVDHLVAADFGGQGLSVVADFYDVGTGKTQVAGGALNADGKYLLGTGSALLNQSGTNGWKISAMAAGKVAGAAHPQLFTAFSSSGVAQIVRGDGVTSEVGSSHPGFSSGSTLYSSSSWEIPAMTTGKIDGSGTVKLVTAFFQPTTSVKTAIYLGSGSGSDGANDGGLIWQNPTDRVTSLTTGTFDGSQERLITGIASSGVGKIFAQTGTSPINIQGTSLYSSPLWKISGVARAEVSSGGSGDEVLAAFDRSPNDTATQVSAGNGETSVSDDGEAFYKWP